MKILKTLLLLITVTSVAQICVAQSDNISRRDTTTYGRNKAVGMYVKTRGIKLYYETYGEGEPLLIIHGNGGSINNFIYQIPYFAKSYKVILADSRAQGKSIDKGDSLSYEMMTDDLNALLELLPMTGKYQGEEWLDQTKHQLLSEDDSLRNLFRKGFKSSIVGRQTSCPQNCYF